MAEPRTAVAGPGCKFESDGRGRLEAQRKKLQDLADRITALEGRPEIVVAEAKGGAGAAASAAVTQNLVEIARSLGALEERVRALEEQTLSSRRIEGSGAPEA